MAIPWSRVADMTQRTVSLALSGLTLVGLAVLARGGYGVMQRKKNRESLVLEEQQNRLAAAAEVYTYRPVAVTSTSRTRVEQLRQKLFF